MTPAPVWLFACILAGLALTMSRLVRSLWREGSRQPNLAEGGGRFARLAQTPWIYGAVGGGGGLAVFLGGWIGGIAFLRRPLGDGVAMNPLAAIAIVLLGIGVCLGASGLDVRVRIVGHICAAAALALGQLTLIGYAAAAWLGDDRILAGQGGAAPVQLATAVSLMLLGYALMVPGQGRGWRAAEAAALVSSALSLLAVMGYVLGAGELYRVGGMMGLPAATALQVLGAGTLLLRREHGVLRTLLSNCAGGLIARRLAFPAIFVPAAMGWLGWQAQLRGSYGPSFGLAVTATGAVVLLGVLTWLVSRLAASLELDRSRAWARMHESEARLRQKIDVMHQLGWAIGLDGRIEYVNRRSLEYTGLSAEAAVKDGEWWSVIHEEDCPLFQERRQAALAAESRFECECRLRAASGEYRWHLISTAPIRGQAGEIVRWFGVAADVQDARSAQERLRAVNQTLESRLDERTAELESAKRELREVAGKRLQNGADFENTPRPSTYAGDGAGDGAPLDAAYEFDVEHAVRAIVPAYLRNRRDDLAAIPVLIEARNFDRLRSIGNNLKGSGSTYGFTGLTALGAAIEAAARNRDTDAVQRGATEMAAMLEGLERALTAGVA